MQHRSAWFPGADETGQPDTPVTLMRALLLCDRGNRRGGIGLEVRP
jgi:hypothetical protein